MGPNDIGYIGNTCYSLKYIARTRNFRYTWPINNLFHIAKNENTLLQSILSQKVGIQLTEMTKNNHEELKPILKKFLFRHRKTNYKLILRKCLRQNKRFTDEQVDKNSTKSVQPVSRQIVKEFLHRLIHNIIPSSLFGSKKNQLQFERNLKHIIYFGKAQVYNLNMIMNKISTKKIIFLRSYSTNINKTNILAKVYLWLIRTFLSASLKCVFYITESNFSNKYLFYEKHIWQKIQQKHLNSLKKTVQRNYKGFPVNGLIIKSKNLFLLKFLPKTVGIRPVFLKWRQDEYSKYKSAHEVRIMKRLLFTIASFHFIVSNTSAEEFHDRWLNLYFTWLSINKPKVFFVRVDFVNAFGNILHNKLMEIIEKLKNENHDITEIEYTYDHRTRKIPINDAYKILKNYVTNFTFKNNKYVYKLIEGICQGGPLSSSLCNLYFGELNITYFIEFLNDPVGLFAQHCDDYLYITMDFEKAKGFLRRLEEGFPDFNLQINRDKTETNIHDSSNHVAEFGSYYIDIESFQLFGSYKSYQGISIFHRSVFRSLKSPGEILIKRLLLSASKKMDKVLLDCTYNSIHTVLYNVFLVANLAAARCLSFIKAVFTNYNLNYIFLCIQKSTSHLTKTALKKIELHKDIIDENTLKWLTLKAYHLRFKNSGIIFMKLVCKIQRHLDTTSKSFSDQQKSEILDKFENAKLPTVFRNLL